LFSDLLNKADWIMAAPRRVVELAFAREDVAELTRLARSRTEPVSRAERARMLLAYRETPSFYAVGRALGVTHQTVERCLRRAEKLGIMEALDDSPRPGRERIITEEARTFVVDLACRKPKDLGYPHELWTTRLLTRHIREHGPAVGHKCLANLAQGTLCKILAAYELDFGQFSSAARDAEHRITLNDLVSALEHELHAAEVPECRPPPFDA
jgi:transposase